MPLSALSSVPSRAMQHQEDDLHAPNYNFWDQGNKSKEETLRVKTT